MPKLHLETHEHRTHLEPGQVLQGVAGWELDEPPDSVELRLCWYTEGKGDQDIHIAHAQTFADPPAVDARVFELPLPAGPYSFSGRLITLRWAVELIVNGRDSTRLDLVVAPGAEELDLAASPAIEPIENL